MMREMNILSDLNLKLLSYQVNTLLSASTTIEKDM